MKNKLLIISIIVAFVFSSYSKETKYNQESDKILWSKDRKLKWNDFKGKQRSNSISSVAETAGEIITDSAYLLNGIPKFEIRCYFLKRKSWTVTKEDKHLEHEQLHFDIYELFTRKIRKSYDSLYNMKCTDFSVYQEIFNQELKNCNTTNNKYDKEAYFNELSQQMWIDSIGNELKILKEYEYIGDVPKG